MRPRQSCSASRYSLLTGRYAIRAGINGALMPESANGLGSGETTIADILKSAGYRTGMVGKWHLGNKPGFFPTEHGFDSSFGLLYSNDMVRPWVQTDVPLRLFRGTQRASGRCRQRNPHRALHRGGRRLHPGEQGPAVLPLPGPLDAARAARRVAAVRGPVGERPLRRRRRDDRLEHGPGARRAAGRRRRARHARHLHQRQRAVDGHAAPDARRSRIVRTDAGSAGPLRGSKGTTWEGGVRVPFLARWPGSIPAGSVSSDLATTLDLLPTIAGIVGAPLPAGRAVDGRDIRAFLEGRAPSPVEWYVYNYNGKVEGVRDRRWKLHLTFPAKSEPVAALYDLLARSVGALGRGRRTPGHRQPAARAASTIRRRGGQVARRHVDPAFDNAQAREGMSEPQRSPDGGSPRFGVYRGTRRQYSSYSAPNRSRSSRSSSSTTR